MPLSAPSSPSTGAHRPATVDLDIRTETSAAGITPVSPAAFTESFSHLATSVWVVSTGRGEHRLGRTVTSMMSLAVDPASVMVSIMTDTPLAAAIDAESGFSLAMLAIGHEAISDAFAGKLPPEARFAAGGRWTAWPSGRPLLTGAAVALDCVLTGTVNAGSHQVFTGTVIAAESSNAAPLLWHRRAYATLAEPAG